MPNPVRAVGDLLKVQRSPFNIATLDFDAPSVEKCARDLKLDKQAKKDGRAGIPDSADTEPGGFELKIHQFVERQIAETKADAEVALMGLDEQIQHLDVEDMFKSLQRAPAELRLEIDAVTQSAELALDRSREDLESARHEYDTFRKERQITREPDYPAEKAPLLWFAFGVAVAEALMNAWFFASGSEQGLVGGLVMAMLFAMGDILVSFNLGRFARKVVVPRWGYRLLGGAASLVFVAWAFSYNFVAGHLREALQTMRWTEAAKEALIRFLENPFALHEIESWILVGIGTVLTVFVMGDGARYDESWFNFERLHRRMRSYQEEYDFRKRAANARALEVKKKLSEEVSLKITEMQDRIATRETCIERKAVLTRNYATFIQTSQEACKAAVQLYRDANRAARKSADASDPPEYFRTHHKCDLGHAATEEQGEHRAQLVKQREMLEKAQDMRLELLQSLDDTYEEAVAKFVQSVERAVKVGSEESGA